MKLSKCRIGELVIAEDLRIGHIVGLTFNVRVSQTKDMSNPEKLDRTIPLVKFVGEELPYGIHHNNIELFKG